MSKHRLQKLVRVNSLRSESQRQRIRLARRVAQGLHVKWTIWPRQWQPIRRRVAWEAGRRQVHGVQKLADCSPNSAEQSWLWHEDAGCVENYWPIYVPAFAGPKCCHRPRETRTKWLASWPKLRIPPIRDVYPRRSVSIRPLLVLHLPEPCSRLMVHLQRQLGWSSLS